MKCIVCEKEYVSTIPDELGVQCMSAGTIEIHFGYGSDYDMIHQIGDELPIDDEELSPDQRLAKCQKIFGILCDNCFKIKSHLFNGYWEYLERKYIKKV